MSLVVGKTDLGSPLAAAVAMKDLARFADEPEIFSLLYQDGESVDRERAARLRARARRLLADHGTRLQQETRTLLSRVASLK